jgi:hypothetical protein
MRGKAARHRQMRGVGGQRQIARIGQIDQGLFGAFLGLIPAPGDFDVEPFGK